MKKVDLYWSHQSAYCYLVLDRVLALDAREGISVRLRPVLPGVLRNASRFADASAREIAYFELDVARTARFLGIPCRDPRPSPVAFVPGTWRTAEEQPLVRPLYHLTMAAVARGRGLAFLDRVSRLLWDGRTDDWHEGDRLARAIAAAGLEPDALRAEAETRATAFDRALRANHEALLEAGHWGVPTFVLDGEPFFGQDRFDQLLWRLDLGAGA